MGVFVSAEEARRIVQGKQHQLRRPLGKQKLSEGKSYALKVGKAPSKLKITVLELSEQNQSDFSIRDAKREGYRTTKEAREHWPQKLKDAQRHQLVSFSLGDNSDQIRLLRSGAPAMVLCKASIKWIDFSTDPPLEWTQPCHRAFADNQEVCKCGTRRPAETEEDRGYTTRTQAALKNAGEEVSESWQKRYAKQAEEQYIGIVADRSKRLQAAIAEIKLHANGENVNKRLREAQRRAKKCSPLDVVL